MLIQSAGDRFTLRSRFDDPRRWLSTVLRAGPSERVRPEFSRLRRSESLPLPREAALVALKAPEEPSASPSALSDSNHMARLSESGIRVSAMSAEVPMRISEKSQCRFHTGWSVASFVFGLAGEIFYFQTFPKRTARPRAQAGDAVTADTEVTSS